MSGQSFSVIVPLHSKATYAGRCLESIFAQKHGDFEVVVVDKDPRVRVIVQENTGPGAPRNRGAAELRWQKAGCQNCWQAFLPR